MEQRYFPTGDYVGQPCLPSSVYGAFLAAVSARAKAAGRVAVLEELAGLTLIAVEDGRPNGLPETYLRENLPAALVIGVPLGGSIAVERRQAVALYAGVTVQGTLVLSHQPIPPGRLGSTPRMPLPNTGAEPAMAACAA